MNLSREDLIILTAANIYAGSNAFNIEESVNRALRIESEVKKQRKAQADAPDAKEYLKRMRREAEQESTPNLNCYNGPHIAR